VVEGRISFMNDFLDIEKIKNCATRDPRTDPQDGDVIYAQSMKIHIDGVNNGMVLYRVTDRDGGLIRSRRVLLECWRNLAMEQARLKP